MLVRRKARACLVGTVGVLCHREGMETADHLLMLSGVSARCAECGDECVFVPVDAHSHEWCCTRCDAAVFLLPVVDTVLHASRVA
jgi:hypothetical protein